MKIKETLKKIWYFINKKNNKKNDTKSTLEISEKNPYFGIVKVGEKWGVIFGKYAISNETYSSKEEAEKSIDNITWDKIINVIGIYFDYRNETVNAQAVSNSEPNINNTK